MWGTSSPGDKLTGDFGNEPDATSISDRGLFRLLAGNLPAGVFRLFQQCVMSPLPFRTRHVVRIVHAHSPMNLEASQGRSAGYRIADNQSGGNGTILQPVSRWLRMGLSTVRSVPASATAWASCARASRPRS